MQMFEQLEKRQLFAVTFSLVNADTNAVVKTITDGMVVDLSQTSIKNYSVIATTDKSAASVKLNEAEIGHTQVESVKPFALFGDTNGDCDFH